MHIIVLIVLKKYLRPQDWEFSAGNVWVAASLQENAQQSAFSSTTSMACQPPVYCSKTEGDDGQGRDMR